MHYYEVQSQLVVLNNEDAYVASEKALNEFDLLVIDSKEHGFITVSISRKLTNFEAISMPFEISTYLMKMDIEGYMRNIFRLQDDWIFEKEESGNQCRCHP